MRVVLQRVSEASVIIDEKVKSAINNGILVFLGIEETDTSEDITWLCNKIINLRIFNDENGVMNRSLFEENGDVIVVSQFTLHASTKKGNRPGYSKAAKPEIAVSKYEEFISHLESKLNKSIGSGEFGADMKVALLNDGPVTILIDSKNRE